MSERRRPYVTACGKRSWPRPFNFEPTRQSRLADILEAIEAIRQHLRRGDPQDGLVYDAVRVRLIEIGEAVKGIDPELLDRVPGVPWKEIARMRDHLTHRYFDTDHAIVEDIVEHDLGPLADAVQSLTDQVTPDDPSGGLTWGFTSLGMVDEPIGLAPEELASPAWAFHHLSRCPCHGVPMSSGSRLSAARYDSMSAWEQTIEATLRR